MYRFSNYLTITIKILECSEKVIKLDDIKRPIIIMALVHRGQQKQVF